MAPSGRGRTRSTRRSKRLDQPEKQAEASAWLDQPEKQAEASASLDQEAEASASLNQDAEASASVESLNNLSKIDGVNFESSTCCGCSTPKAKRFRIPEILTCPPAPKKRRPAASNCSLRRNPIAFFAPPDLELFFFFAVRDIPV